MMVNNFVANTEHILSNYKQLVYSHDCFMLVIQPGNDFENTIVRTQN